MHHTLHVDKSHQLGHAATTEHPAYGVLEYRDLLRVKLALGVFRTAPTNLHVLSMLAGVVVGESPCSLLLLHTLRLFGPDREGIPHRR